MLQEILNVLQGNNFGMKYVSLCFNTLQNQPKDKNFGTLFGCEYL